MTEIEYAALVDWYPQENSETAGKILPTAALPSNNFHMDWRGKESGPLVYKSLKLNNCGVFAFFFGYIENSKTGVKSVFRIMRRIFHFYPPLCLKFFLVDKYLASYKLSYRWACKCV